MRAFSILVLLAALAILMASPVAAQPRHTGCAAAASGWEPVTYDEWIARTELYDPANAPLPAEVVAEIRAALEAFDKNADGIVCWKEFRPSLIGAWPPGFFMIGDNTTAAGRQM